MKSKFIKDIVFVNPSPNMIKLSKIIEGMGYNVVFSFTDLYFPCYFDNVYMVDNEIMHYSFSSYGDLDKEHIYYLFNKTLYNRLKFFTYKWKNKFHTFTLLEKMSSLEREQFNNELKTVKLNDILRNENYKIIFSYISHNDILNIGFSGIEYNIFRVDGEQEFINAISKSTFYILKKDEIGIFKYDNNLIVVTKDSNLELSKIYKYIRKYNIEFKKVGQIIKNNNPWIEIKSLNGKQFYYINDYSILNLSVHMWDDWYKKLARFICTEKQ